MCGWVPAVALALSLTALAGCGDGQASQPWLRRTVALRVNGRLRRLRSTLGRVLVIAAGAKHPRITHPITEVVAYSP